jgi:hypothetical protein
VADSRQLAEAVRAACIKAALDAYEEGGVLGLCAEGRWEYAVSALRQLDVAAVLGAPSDAPPNEPARPWPGEIVANRYCFGQTDGPETGSSSDSI